MSVQAMSWVFEHSSAHWGARLVLLAIANHADRDGRNSWASVRQLAEEAHLSTRQVQRALRELESTQEVIQVGVSPHRTHVYELPLMATLFPISQEGDNLSPVNLSGRHIVPGGATDRPDKGDTVSPEPKSNHPKATVLRTSDVPPEAKKLCELLADLIAENGSKPPTITEAWLTEARRLLFLDKRPLDEAERVLRWCQADDFWRANVLSMPTFRKQYDRLRLASTRTTHRQVRDRAAEIMQGAIAKGGESRGALPG